MKTLQDFTKNAVMKGFPEAAEDNSFFAYYSGFRKHVEVVIRCDGEPVVTA
jgi:hypothetical protein